MITVMNKVALMTAAMNRPPSEPSGFARLRHRLSASSTSDADAAMNIDSSGVDRMAAPAVGVIISTPRPLRAPPAA